MITASGFQYWIYPRNRKPARYTLAWPRPGRTNATKSFKTKTEARQYANGLEEAYVEAKKQGALGEDSALRDYAAVWLARNAAVWQPSTRTSNAWAVRRIVGELGEMTLRALTRAQCKTFLLGLLKPAGPLAKASVGQIRAVLHTMLEEARSIDRIIAENPATFTGRTQLRLRPSRAERRAKIKAFTREQLSAFLAVDPAAANVPESHMLQFETMALTGLRPGEANALQWETIDRVTRQVYVCRHIARAKKAYVADGTKTHSTRYVELPAPLLARLSRWETKSKASALKAGRPASPWVFASRTGNFLDRRQLHDSFQRILKAAGLAKHYSPHCLRHTFATLLLGIGTPIQDVQKMLGHTSIQMTVDHYGSWLPLASKGAADTFAEYVKTPATVAEKTPPAVAENVAASA